MKNGNLNMRHKKQILIPLGLFLCIALAYLLTRPLSPPLCEHCGQLHEELEQIEALRGEWIQSPEGKLHSASARIEGREFYLRYQESESSDPVELLLPIHSIRHNRIKTAPDDVGIGYLLFEKNGKDMLSLEVPSSRYGKRDLELQRL